MESIGPASLLEANIKAGVTDESHLQSLGFVIDNGKPRFKIDQPVSGTSAFPNSRLGPTSIRQTSGFDDQDDESFVVLGKDSLQSIQASSLASYSQIQQKSNSLDYTSMISSLTAEETEKKLAELLRENVKLKETLIQNNLAMKQQFNTLANWHDEMSKVHQSHKQKFAETRELIDRLKKENADLKSKLSVELATSNHQDSQKLESFESQTQEQLTAQLNVQSIHQRELEEENTRLTKELTDVKEAFENTQLEHNRISTLSARLTQQLKQSDVKINDLQSHIEILEERLKEKEQSASLANFSLLSLSSTNNQESAQFKEKINELEHKIKQLQELTSTLEQQLNIIGKSSFSPIEDPTDKNDNRNPSEDRQQFIRNLKQYNEKLQNLSSCYAKQGSHYVNVQECLTGSLEIITELEKLKCFQRSEDSGFDKQQMVDKLTNYRGRLISQQLEMINERQQLIKAQSQFQKVFSDYNSVLYELEIMHEENAKLSYVQRANAAVSLQAQIELNEKLLEDARLSLADDNQGKEVLKLEREALDREREALDKEREVINKKRDELRNQQKDQECLRKSMTQLKLTLDNLQMENKNLKENNIDLQSKQTTCESKMQANTETINNLKTELKNFGKQKEQLALLQAQVEVYETDFNEERQARQKAVTERDNLLQELVKLREMNLNLMKTIDENSSSSRSQQHDANGEASGEFDDIVIVTAFSCPKCSLSFTSMRPLQEHVEDCLNLH